MPTTPETIPTTTPTSSIIQFKRPPWGRSAGAATTRASSLIHLRLSADFPRRSDKSIAPTYSESIYFIEIIENNLHF
jgi:hypothetical protein